MDDDERAALNQAITTAMDMTRAGIAASVKNWHIEDVKTWRVWSEGREFFTSKESDARWLADKLNGKA